MIGATYRIENGCRSMPPKDTSASPPRGAIAFARRKFGAKAVGSYLPALTAKSFHKFGFSAVSLITDWPQIAGRDVARYAVPERLKWPRLPETGDDEQGDRTARRSGATLVLRVDGANALQVQYGKRQLIERINAYLGYTAVTDLRIVQAPLGQQPRTEGATRRPRQPLTSEVAGIGDDKLRGALARLGAEVRSGR